MPYLIFRMSTYIDAKSEWQTEIQRRAPIASVEAECIERLNDAVRAT